MDEGRDEESFRWKEMKCRCGKSTYRYEGDYMICQECVMIHMKTCEDCKEETQILYHGKCLSCSMGKKNAR